MALEPDWKHCGADWAAWDLVDASSGKRIQVKQSAALQSWSTDTKRKPSPRYSIKKKTGRYQGADWINDAGRHADLFIFAWHPSTDSDADHRDPLQWIFYVIKEKDLPDNASVGLSVLERLSKPVRYDALASKVKSLSRALDQST